MEYQWNFVWYEKNLILFFDLFFLVSQECCRGNVVIRQESGNNISKYLPKDKRTSTLPTTTITITATKATSTTTTTTTTTTTNG